MKKIVDYVEQPMRDFYYPHPRLYAPETTELGEVLPSMTKQEFIEQCDINNIIKSFSKTGQITHISAKARQGAYMDLPDPTDFQEALHIVADAQNSFATLPSKVRERFDNDPGKFLNFITDPRNEAEARDLGLLTPKATPLPDTSSEPSPEPKNPAQK